MSRPILILTSVHEPCTDYVINELELMGENYIRINYEEALSNTTWTIKLSNCEQKFNINNLIQHDLNPKSVWMRRWGHPLLPNSFDDKAKFFCFNEMLSVISSLPSLIETKWINQPYAERLVSNKLLQLKVAKNSGWLVPRTLVTNNVEDVLIFSDYVGEVIFKPISSTQSSYHKFNQVAFEKLNEKYKGEDLDYGIKTEIELIFTQELSGEMIDNLRSLKWSPVIFQAKIKKKFDLRVTVVGRDIFTCRIMSQIRDDTKVDFRYMNLTGMLPHDLIELPDVINNNIPNLMDELGLIFGCIDLLEDINGNYIFLEVNPSGQWLWVEQLTGAPISKSLSKILSLN